jgi:ADP-heptose:LPS heptosyltransferase
VRLRGQAGERDGERVRAVDRGDEDVDLLGPGVSPDGVLGRLRPRSLVVLRALPGLGDMLCAVPALRALRDALPGAGITLLTLPGVMPLVERFAGLVDDFLAFPGWPGVPEVPFDAGSLPPFLRRVQARRYDLAVQLHGNGMRTNAFVELLGAEHTAGHYLPGVFTPADEDLWRAYPGRGHEIDVLLGLTTRLGAPERGRDVRFPILPAERRLATRLLRTEGLRPGGFAVIHPGANEASRRWPPEAFARVADGLRALGLELVLTGSDAERPLTAEVRRHARSAFHDLTGRTGLGALAAVLDQAALVVCNDTGVSHLAAAVEAPSVVVFSGSDPDRWAPLDGRLHRPVGPEPPPPAFDVGVRCLRDACLLAPDPARLHGPAPEQALREAQRLLAELGSAAGRAGSRSA